MSSFILLRLMAVNKRSSGPLLTMPSRTQRREPARPATPPGSAPLGSPRLRSAPPAREPSAQAQWRPPALPPVLPPLPPAVDAVGGRNGGGACAVRDGCGAAVSPGSRAGLWGSVTVRLYFVTSDGCSARGCLPQRVPEGRASTASPCPWPGLSGCFSLGGLGHRGPPVVALGWWPAGTDGRTDMGTHTDKMCVTLPPSARRSWEAPFASSQMCFPSLCCDKWKTLGFPLPPKVTVYEFASVQDNEIAVPLKWFTFLLQLPSKVLVACCKPQILIRLGRQAPSPRVKTCSPANKIHSIGREISLHNPTVPPE